MRTDWRRWARRPVPSLSPTVRLPGEDAPGVAGYRVNRKTFYKGRPLNYAWQPEWRLRLVRRGAAAWAGLRVPVLMDGTVVRPEEVPE